MTYQRFSRLSEVVVSTVIGFVMSTNAQITETVKTDSGTVIIGATNSTEEKTLSETDRYTLKYKDADECEDACEDACEKGCHQRCGRNEDCEDECEDECDDRCEQECSVLEPAYGPQKGTVLLSLSGSYLVFHTSGISNEENRFLNETDMHLIYNDNNGVAIDTVKMECLYSSVAGGVGVEYYPYQKAGFGIRYEFMQTNQDLYNKYETASPSLIRTHTVSALVAVYVVQKKRIGFSIRGSFGVLWGGLTRLPLMYKDAEELDYMSVEEEEFVRAIHEKVTLNGITGALGISMHFMINRYLMIHGGPRYLYRYLILTDDRFTGYPGSSHSNDIGMTVNFGVLLNGKREIGIRSR